MLEQPNKPAGVAVGRRADMWSNTTVTRLLCCLGGEISDTRLLEYESVFFQLRLLSRCMTQTGCQGDRPRAVPMALCYCSFRPPATPLPSYGVCRYHGQHNSARARDNTTTLQSRAPTSGVAVGLAHWEDIGDWGRITPREKYGTEGICMRAHVTRSGEIQRTAINYPRKTIPGRMIILT